MSAKPKFDPIREEAQTPRGVNLEEDISSDEERESIQDSEAKLAHSREHVQNGPVPIIRYGEGERPAIYNNCVKRMAYAIGIKKVSGQICDYLNDIVFTMLFRVVFSADLYRENRKVKRITTENIEHALKHLKIDMYKEAYETLTVIQKSSRRKESKKNQRTRQRDPVKFNMNLLNNGQYFKIVPRFVVVKLLKGVVEIIKANKTVDGSVFYEHFLPMSDAIIDYFSVIIVECTLKLLHRANTYTQADNRKILKIRDIFAALVADKGDSNPCFPTDVSEAFNTRGIRYLGEYIVPGKVNEGAMDLVVDKKILRSVRTLTIKQPNSRK